MGIRTVTPNLSIAYGYGKKIQLSSVEDRWGSARPDYCVTIEIDDIEQLITALRDVQQNMRNDEPW